MLQFMGSKVNAMRDYQAAIQKDPKYSLAYFNAANMYFHQRQFKQALTYYDSALIYNAKDESALLNRAITKVGYQSKNKWKTSLKKKATNCKSSCLGESPSLKLGSCLLVCECLLKKNTLM